MSVFDLKKRRASVSSSHLSNYIKERNWNQVRKIITSQKMLTLSRRNSGGYETSQHKNLLCLACMYNPPSSVIAQWIHRCPSAAFEIDCEKRLPVHVACEYGASEDVVQELLRVNREGVYQKDVFGMLPIHRLCRSYCYNSSATGSKKLIENSMIQVLRALLDIAPKTILEEDDTDMCPIEHALESGLSISIIHGMRDKAKRVRIQNEPLFHAGQRMQQISIN